MPLPAKFVRVDRDKDGYLVAVVMSGSDEVICPMRTSDVYMRFLPSGHWFKMLVSADGRGLYNVEGDDFFRFRSELLKSLRRSDLFL